MATVLCACVCLLEKRIVNLVPWIDTTAHTCVGHRHFIREKKLYRQNFTIGNDTDKRNNGEGDLK